METNYSGTCWDDSPPTPIVVLFRRLVFSSSPSRGAPVQRGPLSFGERTEKMGGLAVVGRLFFLSCGIFGGDSTSLTFLYSPLPSDPSFCFTFPCEPIIVSNESYSGRRVAVGIPIFNGCHYLQVYSFPTTVTTTTRPESKIVGTLFLLFVGMGCDISPFALYSLFFGRNVGLEESCIEIGRDGGHGSCELWCRRGHVWDLSSRGRIGIPGPIHSLLYRHGPLCLECQDPITNTYYTATIDTEHWNVCLEFYCLFRTALVSDAFQLQTIIVGSRTTGTLSFH
jgi:hypothetical protein